MEHVTTRERTAFREARKNGWGEAIYHESVAGGQIASLYSIDHAIGRS